jgi:MHS family shikimate/dehydroshikimate transporter-like MFS transporter
MKRISMHCNIHLARVHHQESVMANASAESGRAEGKHASSITHVALASFIGTAIEWYDFFLYGTAAALVFNKLFFPSFDQLVGTLLAFGTYAVGFVARPVGGIVFGHYGDKIGRKTMLSLSLLIMGVATCLIGFLPTYESLGIGAAILLVTLRLAQGFGLGGEWGGAVLMAVEHAPKHKRGFYGSWPQMGAPAGLLLANGVFFLISSKLSEETFLAWGWRIPFLLSALLVFVGLFIRLRLAESPAFAKVKETGKEAKMPIIEVLRHHPKNILLAMGARFAENGFFYILTVFVLTYATEQLKVERDIVLTGVLIATACHLFAIPLFGMLSDRLGRRPVYLMGAIFSGLFAFPFFWLLDTREPTMIWLAITVGVAIGHAAMYGPQASFFSELFGTRVRYSGASLGYQLASVFAGGLSPLIATQLIISSGGSARPVAIYMVGLAVITAVSVWFAAETFKHDISSDHPPQK